MTHGTRFLRRVSMAALVVTLLGAGLAVRPAAAAGGAFTATYSGAFTLTNCPLLGVLRTACVLHLNSTGFASDPNLGASTETGTLVANLNLLPLQCGSEFGVITLRSTQTPANSVTVVVRGQICAPLLGGLLGGKAPFTLQYRVVRGTGALSTASGQGTITGTDRFSLLAARGEATDQWSGSLMP